MTSVGSVEIDLILQQGRLNQQLNQAQQRLEKLKNVDISLTASPALLQQTLNQFRSTAESTPVVVPVIANAASLIATLRAIPIPTIRAPIQADPSSLKKLSLPIVVGESNQAGQRLSDLVARLRERLKFTQNRVILPTFIRETTDPTGKLGTLLTSIRNRLANNRNRIVAPVYLDLAEGEIARLRAQIAQGLGQQGPRPGEIRSEFRPPDVQAAAGAGDQQQFKLEPKDLAEFKRQIEGLSAEEISVRISRKDLQRFGKELRQELSLTTEQINAGGTNLGIAESIKRELDRVRAEAAQTVNQIEAEEITPQVNTAQLEALDQQLLAIQQRLAQVRQDFASTPIEVRTNGEQLNALRQDLAAVAALNALDLPVDLSQLEVAGRAIAELQAQLNALGSATVTPQVSLAELIKLNQELDAKQAHIREVSGMQVSPQVNLGELQALAEQLTTLKRRLRELGRETPTLNVQAEAAIAQLEALQVRAADLRQRLEVPLSLALEAQQVSQSLEQIQQRLAQLPRDYVVEVFLDVGAVIRQIEGVQQRLQALEGDSATLRVSLDDAGIRPQLEALTAQLAPLDVPPLRLNLNVEQLLQSLQDARQNLDNLRRDYVIDLFLDPGGILRQLATVRQAIEGVSALSVAPQISLGEIQSLQSLLQSVDDQMQALNQQIVTPQVNLNAFRDALSGLTRLQQSLEALNQTAVTPEITVSEVDAAIARVETLGRRLQSLSNLRPELGNLQGVLGQLGQIGAGLEGLQAIARQPITPRLDEATIAAQVQNLQAQLQALAQQQVPVPVDLSNLEQISEQVRQELQGIAQRQTPIGLSIEQALGQLETVETRLRNLENLRPKIRPDLAAAREAVTNLRGEIQSLRDAVALNLNASGALASVAKVRQQILDLATAQPQIQADLQQITPQLETIENRIRGLSQVMPPLDVDVTRAIGKLEAVEARLNSLRTVQPRITLDAEAAVASLRTLREELQATRNQSTLNVQLGTIGNLAAVTKDLKALNAQLQAIQKNKDINLRLGETGAARTLNFAAQIGKVLLDLDRVGQQPLNFAAFDQIIAKAETARDKILDLRSLTKQALKIDADTSELNALNELIAVTTKNLRGLRSEAERVIPVRIRTPRATEPRAVAETAPAAPTEESLGARRLSEAQAGLTRQLNQVVEAQIAAQRRIADELRQGVIDEEAAARQRVQAQVQAAEASIDAYERYIARLEALRNQNLLSEKRAAAEILKVNQKIATLTGKELTGGIAGAKQQTKAAEDIFKTNAALTAQRAQLESTTVATGAYSAAQDRAAASVNRLENEQRGLGGLFREIRDELGQSLKVLLLYGAAFEAIKFPVNAFRTVSELEALNTSLEFISGSAIEAGKNIGFINAEVDRLSLPLQDSIKNFTQLAAAAKGTALEGQATQEIFTGIAQAGRVLGLDAEKLNKSFLATTQIISKGVVTQEELRGQLSEALPNAIQVFARALGVSTQRLQEMIQAGEVGLPELRKFAQQLAEETESGVVGALNTANAATARFQTSVTRLQESIGQEILPGAVAGINAVTNALNGLSANADLVTALLAGGLGVGAIKLAQSMGLVTGATSLYNATLGAGALQAKLYIAQLVAIRGATLAQRAAALESVAALKAQQSAAAAARSSLAGIAGTAAGIAGLAIVFDQVRTAITLLRDDAKDVRDVLENIAELENRQNIRGGGRPQQPIGLEKRNLDIRKQVEEGTLDIPVFGRVLDIPINIFLTSEATRNYNQIQDQLIAIKDLEKEVNQTIAEGQAIRNRQARGEVVPQQEIDNQKERLDALLNQINQIAPQSSGAQVALQNLIKALEAQGAGAKAAAESNEKLVDSIKELQDAYDRAKGQIETRRGVLGSRIQEDLARGIISEQQALERTAANLRTFGAGDIAVNNKFAEELKKAPLTEEFTAKDRQNALNKIASENAQIRVDIAEAERDARVQIEEDRANRVERIATQAASNLAIAESRANAAVNRALAAGAITPERAEEVRGDIRRQALERQFANEQQNLKRLQALRFSDVQAQEANDDKIADSRRNLAQIEADLAQNSVEVRTRANQRILDSVEFINRRIEVSDKQAQNARIAAVRQAQRERRLTEEKAATDIARIATYGTELEIVQQRNRLSRIRELAKARVISARDAALQELEIRSNLSDLELQLVENQLAEEASLRQEELTKLRDLQETQGIRSQAIVAGIENQTKALERQTAVIDRQKQLLESRQNLFEAQGSLRQTGEQVNIDRLAAALGIIEQLNSEEEKSITQRIGLQKVLEAITGNFVANELNQLETLQRRQAAENRLAKIQKENLLAQQAAQRVTLELDLQRNQILAQQAILQAEVAKQQAIQNAVAAQFRAEELAIDPNTRPEQLANAQRLAELANQQIGQAQASIDLAKDNAAVQADIAENARFTLQAQQQAALYQNQAAEAARKLAQANELAGLEAKGIAAAAAATAEAYERAARAYAGLRNGGNIEVPRSAPSLARDNTQTLPSRQNQNQGTGGTINNIGNLMISTPQPTADAARVLQDLSRSSVSGAGL